MEDDDNGHDVICKNYTPCDLKADKDTWNGYNIKGINMNIRNVTRNIDQFNALLDEIGICWDFFSFSETWVNEEQAKNYGIDFREYHMVWSKDKYNKNGGVGIGIHVSKEYQIIDQGNGKIEADYLIIEMKEKSQKNNYILIIIYRNPKRDQKKFIRDVKTLLEEDRYKGRNIIIMGDWNIDVSGSDAIAEKLKENMAKEGFLQTIEGFTRITKNTKTSIDLCYTNMIKEVIKSGTICSGITDHQGIIIGIQTEGNNKDYAVNREKATSKNILNYSGMKREISKTDWSDIKNEDDPNKSMNKFQNRIQRIIKENEKIIKVTNHYTGNKEIWMTNELVKKIRKRDRLIYKRNKEAEECRRKDKTVRNKEIRK